MGFKSAFKGLSTLSSAFGLTDYPIADIDLGRPCIRCITYLLHGAESFLRS